MTKAGAFDHNGDDVAAGSLRRRRGRHDNAGSGHRSSSHPFTPIQCAHDIKS